MYASHFGLSDNPFSITPDPRYLYLSPFHREALAHLIYGTGEDGGFVQLTGEVGTGKTTLIRALTSQPLPNVDVALSFNPQLTVEEFVAAICDELHVEYPRQSPTLKPIIDALNTHLFNNHAQGRRTVLIVDEAQNLSRAVLEQIRLLTNLETRRHKLLRIILVGQPELKETLAREDMRQVSQRITARYHLAPLRPKDTVAYIERRLKVAGGSPHIFTTRAMRAVHRLSGGLPRFINVLCDRALLGAYTQDRTKVDATTVRNAAREIMHTSPSSPRTKRRVRWAFAAIVAVSSVLILWVAERNALLPELSARLVLLRSSISADLSAPKQPAALEQDRTGVTQDEPLAEAASPGDESSGHPGRETAPAPATLATSTSNVNHKGSTPTDAPSRNIALAALPPPPIDAPSGAAGGADNDGNVSHWVETRDPFELLHPSGSAFAALLRLWGEDPESFPESPTCKTVVARDMRCSYHRGDWDELRRNNRPVVLSLLNDRNNTRRALVRMLDGDTVFLDVAGEAVPFSTSVISEYWDGDYLMLWRLRTSQSRIGPGSRGEAVVWLRNQLALAEGRNLADEPVSAEFDDELREQVRRFQRGRELVDDGIVGYQTMLHLNNISEEPGTPTLLSQQR